MAKFSKLTIDETTLELFGDMVEAKAESGTLKAIRKQKEDCTKEFLNTFVTQKECNERSTICRRGVYKKIDKLNNNKPLKTLNYDDNDDEKNIKKHPSISIVFQHFDKNKLTYAVGIGFGIIGGIISFIINELGWLN